MKTCFFIFLFLISCVSFSQNNYIVKTEDGRRVLLKADYTWEYIDLEVPAEKKSDSISVSTPAVGKTDSCDLAADFKEPELNNKIQSQLKKGRATINHVKIKVAKDEGCAVEDVILLSVKEKKTQAVYLFCANGKKVSYKRHGNSIMKSGKLF